MRTSRDIREGLGDVGREIHLNLGALVLRGSLECTVRNGFMWWATPCLPPASENWHFYLFSPLIICLHRELDPTLRQGQDYVLSPSITLCVWHKQTRLLKSSLEGC